MLFRCTVRKVARQSSPKQPACSSSLTCAPLLTQVGVGGSGKQSLAKLAAHICGYEVFQISVTSTYGAAEFKADLVTLYTRAGVKAVPTVFLMTDGQIVSEQFLVYLNDLLSSGYIPDLFATDEKDAICNSLRTEVKQVSRPLRVSEEKAAAFIS